MNQKNEILNVKVDSLRKRNQSLSDKLSMFRTQEQLTQKDTIEKAEQKRSQRTLRMRDYYKEEKQSFDQAKQDRKDAFDFLRTRQGDNSQAIKARNRQIMMKLKRSQKQVEDYMRAQNHELMLKQELRQLRVGDILKKKVREKRKDLSAKEQIIKKEQDDEKLLKTMRDREQILINTRNTNMMKSNLEKVAHIENLEKWVARGFSTSRTTKKKVKLNQSPNLEKLQKIMVAPIKIERNEEPDD